MTGDFYRNTRAIKQTRSLSAAGFQVRVFHLAGNAPPVSMPDAVQVVDLPRPPGRGPFFFRNVNRLFSRALAGVEAAVMHASDLYALSACRRRADELGCALTYDAREYYPHVAGTVGRPWSRWWWRRVEQRDIVRADQVFTVSDSIADALRADYSIVRPVVVHNAPPSSAPIPENSSSSLGDRLDLTAPIVLHLGQMKAHRGGPNLIRAMRDVPEAHLVFLGYGSEQQQLTNLVTELNLTGRVHFLPPVSPDEIRHAIRDAHIGVTMLEGTCLNHRFALPNKLFDYVHAGIPVLGADLDEVRMVIDSHDIGMTANPSDPASIASALRRMLDAGNQTRWRSNMKQAAETFSWESASQRFTDGIVRAQTART